MHYLKWEHSRLNIRCWQCSEILVTISTDGSSLNFKSNVEYLEISCPICHTTCEYSLIEKGDGLFKSHDWDSDIDSLDFDGQTGEVNRNLLRQYKTLLFAGEALKNSWKMSFILLGIIWNF
jgi:phage FluMu protein Com